MALLHRYLDPLLGVFTGILAYHLHETHPRTAPLPDQRLTELVRWKWDKYQRERREKLLALETGEQWPPSELTK
ncbi:hypothetical protein P691DRAFT_770451 [Macrolepiota fuliginosa MF-IS2]|uniref:Uncharacterized protein n=1 Tax=Macrolepiota fuliginosa MF-IS2 TaxID=1400762 RepID=A0A9P5XRQ3_9AGAR|nr:hypothetical protein P691DRAFT_770451 [Macrolepiota fuliginosa MF-IS2]